MPLRLLFAAALALAACAELEAAELPPGAALLPASEARDMLRQCSRAAPEPGEDGWRPSAEHIAALESALPAALAAQRPGGNLDWSRAPQGWRRQYVGIVREGRRYIYGNFFPDGMDQRDPDRWLSEAVRVCDGGPAFFGVEYDVEAGRFTHFGFNGGA